jgi:Fuc2NAc and GlcNAc transferase
MFIKFSMLVTLLFLLVGSVFLVSLYASYAEGRGLLDVPNTRSAHQIITPRGAGIVFIGIWLLFVLFNFQANVINPEYFWMTFPAPFMMMSLGFWDDLKSLSPRRRLFFQGIAALVVLFVFFNFGLEMNGFHLFGVQYFFSLGTSVASLLAVLWLMWSTNLFNFMDGLDGLAAIEALFVFAVTGFLYFTQGDPNLAYLPWGLCCTVLGFLVWNWPKAKVFMGDVGSYSLGFLIAIFALIGDVKFGIPYLLWVIMYSVFWFDATITLLRRLLMGRNVAMAHREHAYQRLHQAGFSHKKILHWVIALNTLLAAMTIWGSVNQEYILPILGVTLLILSVCYYQIERLNPMRKKNEQ